MASKIIYVLGGMVMLNLAMWLFACTSWDPTTGECIAALSDTNSSSLISFLSNPTVTSEGGFWQILFGNAWGLLALVGVGISVIIVGAVWAKGEAAVWVAMAIGLTSCVYPLIGFWILLRDLTTIGDVVSRTVLLISVGSIMILTVLFTIVDWARGRE